MDAEYRAEPTMAGLAYPGYRFLVSGEPESLKSWLAAGLAVDRVRANENVVWIDFEQGPAMTRERFQALGLSVDQLARVFYLEPREPLSDDGREQLVEHIAFVRPTLTVFDAYAGLLGTFDHDPNSERDIERVNRHVVDIFRDAGSTTVILDHVVKARENRGRYSSGNARKLAEVEVHLGLERAKHFTRGSSGSARIRNHKDRLGGLPYPYVGEVHLASDKKTGAVTWEIKRAERSTADPHESVFRPTFLMERVSRFLELQHEPLSRTTVETDVKGKGPGLRAAMDVLIAERYVTARDGVRGAKLLTSVRPYREADDPVPQEPHEHTDGDPVPPRPDSVSTPSLDGETDSVLRPPPIGRDGDRVNGHADEELERLQALGEEMGLT